jgi:hypothetical protein
LTFFGRNFDEIRQPGSLRPFGLPTNHRAVGSRQNAVSAGHFERSENPSGCNQIKKLDFFRWSKSQAARRGWLRVPRNRVDTDLFSARSVSGTDFEYIFGQLLGCACIFRDGLSRLKRLEDCTVRKNGIMGSFSFYRS